jgi:glycosyltransferase involved in cell wall biosynthesis
MQYYEFLLKKIEQLNLHDNAVIIRKFQTEQTVNHYLRTAKIAIFPYIVDPQNIVYGASGAVRVAMANGLPVIASEGHMFDDLQGILPRPHDHVSLANEIDKIFSDESCKNNLIKRIDNYIAANNWEITADRYLNLYQHVTM